MKKAATKVRCAPYVDANAHRQLMNAERAGPVRRSEIVADALFDYFTRTRDYQLVLKRLASAFRQLSSVTQKVQLHAEVFDQWLVRWLEDNSLDVRQEDEGRRLAEQIHAKLIGRLWNAPEGFVQEVSQENSEQLLERLTSVESSKGVRSVRTEFYLPAQLRAELRQTAAVSQLTEGQIVSRALRQHFSPSSEGPELIAALNKINRQIAALHRAVHNSAQLFDEWLQLWLRSTQHAQGAAQPEQVSRARIEHDRLFSAAAAKLARGEGLLQLLDSGR